MKLSFLSFLISVIIEIFWIIWTVESGTPILHLLVTTATRNAATDDEENLSALDSNDFTQSDAGRLNVDDETRQELFNRLDLYDEVARAESEESW